MLSEQDYPRRFFAAANRTQMQPERDLRPHKIRADGNHRRHKPRSRTIFKITVIVFSIGLALSLFVFDWGLKDCGLGLIRPGTWLLRYDITRHATKKTGLTRYIAVCLKN